MVLSVPTQPHRNREPPGKAAFLSSAYLICFNRRENLFRKLDTLTRFSAPLLLTGLPQNREPVSLKMPRVGPAEAQDPVINYGNGGV